MISLYNVLSLTNCRKEKNSKPTTINFNYHKVYLHEFNEMILFTVVDFENKLIVYFLL